jgi:hypothetical protein
MHLEELGCHCVEWILRLAQDMVWLLALVNTVMNLRVLDVLGDYQLLIKDARFQVFMMVKSEVQVFCVLTPCSASYRNTTGRQNSEDLDFRAQ